MAEDVLSTSVTQAATASGITKLRTPPTVMDPGPPPGLMPKRFVESINPPEIDQAPTGPYPPLDQTPQRPHPLEVPRVTVPVSGKPVVMSAPPGTSLGAEFVQSLNPFPETTLREEKMDLIDIQEYEENGEVSTGMSGKERVPKEIVDRFRRVEFHGTVMIAILSRGFGFQVSRLEPAQQLLLRGRVTEAFTRLLNDPNTLGRVFNRIKFLCQSIWSDRKIGNIIAGMVVSAGLSAYLEDGLLGD